MVETPEHQSDHDGGDNHYRRVVLSFFLVGPNDLPGLLDRLKTEAESFFVIPRDDRSEQSQTSAAGQRKSAPGASY